MRTYPQFGQRSQRKHQMPDPASTSAGSAALLKMFGIHISAGALAAALNAAFGSYDQFKDCL
ncbi:hypothetical protein DT376_17810 [Pseudomonas aeruginosa]|uniref:Uncharacterized protein n=1 Tax=Pseudomonas aeruginosa TaxID=287 RepID=A0A367M7N4_PSEAI|nr:hypothetical protein DT376_17810 [Pseudomonas aeruginosa]